MKTIWIIVANQVEAQIYMSRRQPWDIELLETLVHEEGAAHARDLVTDVPGRVHDRMGSARHGMEPSTGVKEESLRKFVKEMTGLLEKAHLNNRFDQLVILAAPTVLGVIRKNLTDGLTRAVVKEIPKDVIGQGMDNIQTQLKRAFELK
jgi:protein required for attachment to host cells